MKITSLGEKLKNKYTSLKIKDRTLLSVSIVVFGTVLVMAGVFLLFYNHSLEEDNANYAGKQLENVSNSLDTYFDEISSVANEANYNYYLQNFLLEEKGNEARYNNPSNKKVMQNYEMSSKLFDSSLHNHSDISSIMLWGKKTLLLYKSIYTYYPIVQDYSKLPWYQEAYETPMHSVITGPQKHDFLAGNTEQTISLSRMLQSYEDGGFLGVILIDLNLNGIKKICASVSFNNQDDLCILNKQGELVYLQKGGKDYCNLGREEIRSQLAARVEQEEGSFFEKLGGREYQVVSSGLERAGWTIISLTPASALKRPMKAAAGFLLAGTAIILLFLILVLNHILARIINPIVVLKDRMNQVDQGNLDIAVEVPGKDEVGMLSKSFNKMLVRIRNLMDQVVAEQEDKRKYELQALQAQINPHFLYNTLDSIIWMAEMGDHNVVPMTEALAKLFRISLNKGNEMIKVEDEMEHVRNYLIIQSMRYLNKFTYTIAVDDDVRYCKTIKLIVQPVVENAIYHGIKKKKGKGSIQIAAFRNEERLFITVTDDGIGMDEETCEQILQEDSRSGSTTGSGIGVKNVNERIQLYFGREYGLQFESEPGKGTTVTLTLPILEDVIA